MVACWLALVALLVVNFFEVPLLSQILRSPFTKTIAPLSLIYSLLVGASFYYLAAFVAETKWLALLRRYRHLLPLSCGIFIITLVIYALPTFGGNFIYPRLRTHIPEAYQALFDYMHTQPSAARVVLLPADSLYGWQFYNWGVFRGIGFYWFGLKQPILARAFDVWSKEDENFYQELLWARQNESGTLVADVLQKYAVRYILFDESIFQLRKEQFGYNDTWRQLIQEIPGCQRVFLRDFLSVYDCGSAFAAATNFLSTPERYVVSSSPHAGVFYDRTYARFGTYVSPQLPQLTDFASQPFTYLYQREIAAERLDRRSLTADLATITLTAPLPLELSELAQAATLSVPGLPTDRPLELVVQARAVGTEAQLTFTSPMSVEINGQWQSIFPEFTVKLPLADTSSEFYLDFGSSFLRFDTSRLASAQPQLAQVFDLNQAQTWHYFPASAAEVNAGGGLTVAANQVIDLEVSASLWQGFLQPQRLQLVAGAPELKVRLITPELPLQAATADWQQNCDSLKRGWAQKMIVGEQTFEYWSLGFGSSCETFYHTGIDLSQNSYLLVLEADNLQGWPINYYVWDIEGNTSPWENVFLAGQSRKILSWPRLAQRKAGSAFDWHSANRSLAGEEVRNRLITPVAYPVPTEWLGDWLVLTEAQENLAAPINQLQLGETRKFGTSHYRAWVRLTGESGVLVLAQGYHQGWRASINGRPLPHLRVNDWANGWLVTAETCPSGNCQVKIVFWPQWLGWLGLVVSGLLGLGAAGWLGWVRWRTWQLAKKQSTKGMTCSPPSTSSPLPKQVKVIFSGRPKS